MKGRFYWILGSAACVLVLTRAAGQAPAQQAPLRHEVSVTLKLVQVYVTDKSGRPVTDLTGDDFRVFDGGRRVVVTEFERHEVRSAERGIEARPEAPVPSPPEIPSVKRKFILFFDFAFNTHKGVAAGVQAALDFLDDKVGPGDETALVSYSMLGGLKIHEFLTPDRGKVRRAVSEVTSKAIAGRADEVEQAYWTEVDLDGSASTELEMRRRDSLHQAQNYFRALTDFARALRLVQGQKHLLFFSGGVPNSLIRSSQMAGTDQRVGSGGSKSGLPAGSSMAARGSRFEIGDAGLRPLLDAMLKELNGSGCALYAFDTRESSLVSALFTFDEQAFSRRTGGMFLADNVGTAVTSPFRDEKTTGMDTLKLMSGRTGGKYYGNIQFHERDLGEVVDLTGSYYVLGYSISAAADGKFREVKVEVARKGCVVRAQRGYYNPKPFRDYTDIERKLHLFDLALNGRSDLGAPIGVPMTVLVYAAGGGARVRALARIPREVWEALQGRTAEILPLFFDGEENLLSLRRAVVDVAGRRGRDLVFTAEAAAPPGAVDCRLVVRDLDTGQSALARGPGFVREPAAGGLALATPLVLVPGGGAALVEGLTPEGTGDRTWREIYAYDPEAATPVMGDEPVTSETLLLIVPVRVREEARNDLGVNLALVDASTGRGRDVLYTLVRRSRAEGHEVLFLEAAMAGLPAGKYLLYVPAGLGGSDGRASAHVPLTVGR
jgi:VWFA-related protein